MGNLLLKYTKKYTSKFFTIIKIVYIYAGFMDDYTTKMWLQIIKKIISEQGVSDQIHQQHDRDKNHIG
jgi:hypothetical protein